MTKAELLDRISSQELVEWMALYTIRNQERKDALEAQKKAAKPKNIPRTRARRR